jgi:hypothetical protein
MTDDMTQNFVVPPSELRPRDIFVPPRHGNSRGQEEVADEDEFDDYGRFASYYDFFTFCENGTVHIPKLAARKLPYYYHVHLLFISVYMRITKSLRRHCFK